LCLHEPLAGKDITAAISDLVLKDFQQVKLMLARASRIAIDAEGAVRLVKEQETKASYLLKRVKLDGEIPAKVLYECDLLKMLDHPFVVKMLMTLESPRGFYILSEPTTGFDLHSAIRRIPDVLSRTQA